MKVIKGSVFKLLEMKEVLAPQENPLESSGFYLHVQVLPEIRRRRKSSDIVIISQEFKDIIQERFKQSDLSKGGATVDTTHLLDLMDDRGVAHFLVGPVLVGLVALFFFINTIRRIFYLRRQFKLFNTLFPDYANQPERLVKDADFGDHSLRMLVHQDVLVLYGSEFQVVSVKSIDQIKLFRTQRKGHFRYKAKLFFHSGSSLQLDVNRDVIEAQYRFFEYLATLAPIEIVDEWEQNFE